MIKIPLPDGAPWEYIPIYGFGVLVALGFLAGSKVAMNRARRIGLDPDQINKVISWLVAGTFIGGHVGYGLMYEPAAYLAHPEKFLQVWSGLSSMGGFLVCVPVAVYFFWKNKLPVWPYIDCLGIGLAIGWFLGRMGCFVAHDHPGTVTNFWLGVYGICARPDGAPIDKTVACHDMGLYEALWSLGVFVLFLWLDRKPRVPGFYPLLLGILYAPTRFAMDFVRPESTDDRYYGFTPAQYAVVLFFIVCTVFFVQRLRSKEPPVWAPPGSVPAVPAKGT